MKLVCEKCGQKFDAGDRFCKRCGQEIAEVIEQTEIETELTQISTPKNIFKNKKIITAAGITLAALVVIFSLVGNGDDNRPPVEERMDAPEIAGAEEPYEGDISYSDTDSTSSGGYDEMDAIISGSSDYTFQDLGNALAGTTAPASTDSLDGYTDEDLWYICRDIILGELPINPGLAIFPDWGPDNVSVSREDDTVYVMSYVYADDSNGNNKKQYFEITFYGDLDTRQIVIDGTYY